MNIWLIIIPVLVIVVVLFLILKQKMVSPHKKMAIETIENGESKITIPIERLPATMKFDENKLTEIADTTLISRISNTIPIMAETVAKTVSNKTLKNVEIYKAIIPSGATLTKSKDMQGAVRGFYQQGSKIKGQANLIKTDPTKLAKTSAVTSGIMNVGSLVVGQYYMTEINSKLEDMNKGINKIADFQDRKFKSRIMSLIFLVHEISKFSLEIMENDELRKIKLGSLETLKGNAIELLGQANITIKEMAEKNPTPNYKEYQGHIDDFDILVEYQNVLVHILGELSKLTYLLGKGDISTEMSYSSYNELLEQTMKTRDVLDKWHEKQVQTLHIDLDKNRTTKTGISKYVSAIPALVDNNWKYEELKEGMAEKINTQTSTDSQIAPRLENVYDEDVEIIIQNGKYYYRNK